VENLTEMGENRGVGLADTNPNQAAATGGSEDMATPTSKRTTAPAFQFYPKDFLSSSKVMRMTATERGIYITLLCVCWLEGGLPDDVSKLAKLAGVPLKQFSRIWPHNLQSCFTIVRGGKLVNERLDRERQKQAEFRRRQTDNGRRGGRPANPPQTQPLATLANPPQSSPISDLQSPISDLRTAVGGTARPQPIVARRRLDAAWEGPKLYVPQRVHTDFIAFRNHAGAERELLAWYAEVSDAWTIGPHAGQSPGADMIRFWKARYDERWPPVGSANASVADRRPQWIQDVEARKRAKAGA
jgi:uncharacterized protein YdaU (DUF1376 family)